MRVLFQTGRLELVALEAETARAASQNRKLFTRLIDAETPDAWPLEEMRDALPLFETFSEGEAFGGVLIERATRVVVGDAGFHRTPLAGGDAEIGYSLLETARGRGYATEAIQQLLALGWEAGLVTIYARVQPNNGPSHRVLARCGFECEGERDGW
ncbi:N-acetyltransferase, partial [bacterium]